MINLAIVNGLRIKKSGMKSWIKLYSRIGYIAVIFPLSILLGFIAGDWLDKKTGASPFFTILLICAGFIAALRTLLQEIKRLDENEKKEE